MILALSTCVFALSDGESLRNNGGEHVALGVEEGTTNIKWVKLTTEGYTIVSSVPTVATAPTLVIANLTGGLAEALYNFGAHTALSFSVLNTHASDTLYIGTAIGGPYVTVYPHASFSVPFCALASIRYLGTSAATTFDIVFTY